MRFEPEYDDRKAGNGAGSGARPFPHVVQVTRIDHVEALGDHFGARAAYVIMKPSQKRGSMKILTGPGGLKRQGIVEGMPWARVRFDTPPSV